MRLSMRSVVQLMVCCLVLCGCAKKPEAAQNSAESERASTPDAGRKAPADVKRLQGIPFDAFWAAVQKEGRVWAGDRFYVDRIAVVSVSGFDRHDGLSAGWTATIVRGDEITPPSQGRIMRDTRPSVKGARKTVSMSETGIVGAEAGLRVGEENPFTYYGNPMAPDKIKIGAKEAEQIANKYKAFTPTGYEHYVYELESNKGTPVWHIRKQVSLKGQTEGKGAASDYWNVQVNAETGGIVE